MGVLTARCKHAESWMTQANCVKPGHEITFADGCRGLFILGFYRSWKPFGFFQHRMPNPSQANIRVKG